MKRLLFLIPFIFLLNVSFGQEHKPEWAKDSSTTINSNNEVQSRDNFINTPGDYLERAGRRKNITIAGYALTSLGAGLYASQGNFEAATVVSLIGGGLCITITISSNADLQRAGRRMKNNSNQ